jgi:hypothetical protein
MQVLPDLEHRLDRPASYEVVAGREQRIAELSPWAHGRAAASCRAAFPAPSSAARTC